eukprot:3852587-Ditylum_brightwellii.AAC.1
MESAYGTVDANDQRTDGFYIVKFLSTACTLQHDEIVENTILKSGTLVSDANYMCSAMKDSMWHVKSGIKAVKELDYSMSIITQEDVIEKEQFK